MLDVAVLVPAQPIPGSWVDADIRATFAGTRRVVVRARDRVAEMIGVAPTTEHTPARTATSVVLATALERKGLSWRVLDLQVVPLGEWRKHIERLRGAPPRVVAISSTFVIDGYWLGTLCEIVRRALPDARVVVGGYAYATDIENFLSLDADVLCVGEGEERLSKVVEAFRDGRDLGDIPGLYLREKSGRLRYTGDVEPIPIDRLPIPDWALAPRIDPPMDPRIHPNEYCVETQRGCVFKCEFCTYRTIAAPEQSSVEYAVRAIRSHARHQGNIFLIDATATTPRERWVRVLERLIEEGGAPLPTAAYARVADLDEEICSLMARANIATVRVGQESGDQRMLNEMKKGTRVDQIAPAIAALGRAGMRGQFSFLLGFPGETPDSLDRTRQTILTLNDGHEGRPVVHTVGLNVFDIQNLAAVGQREGFRGRQRFAYHDLQISPMRAAEAVLDISLRLSRIPHAPVIITRWGGDMWPLWDLEQGGRESFAFFWWAKAIDRAIAMFAESELGERRVDPRELARLRQQILAGIGDEHQKLGRVRRAAMVVKHRAVWKLLGVWARGESKTGLLTRAVIGFEVGRATGSARDVVAALRTGRHPSLGIVQGTSFIASKNDAAKRLVQLGIATGRRRLRRLSA